MPEPKILLLDVETMPATVYVWNSMPPKFISPDNLVSEAHMACAGWKWLGESEVYVAKMNLALDMPDLPIVKALAKALAEADAVVAQNGDSFDMTWIRARMLKAGLPPPPAIIQIDTKKILRKQFGYHGLFSAKLDYIGQFLDLGRKEKVDFDLWRDVKAGVPGALDRMVRYMIRDIKLLEKVYLTVRAYEPAKLNANLFSEGRVCPQPKCKGKLQSRGYAFTRTQKLQRFVCTTCGHWCRKAKKSEVVR